MKKILAIILCLSLLTPSALCSAQEQSTPGNAQPDYTQDVPLDAVHFPDEHFRGEIAKAVDENQDGVLSREEREKICYLEIGSLGSGIRKSWNWSSDMIHFGEQNYDEEHTVYFKNKLALEIDNDGSGDRRFCALGIEYFFNLEEVYVKSYEQVSFSFQKNKKLRKIWVRCSEADQKNYNDVCKEFPISHLTYMHLENIDVKEIEPKKIPNLKVLHIVLPNGSGRRLPSLDLLKNKKLKVLELGNILPPALDLRNNKKLVSVKVYSGEKKFGKTHCFYKVPGDQKCRIRLAKKNNIQILHYFTSDGKIDVSGADKLEEFYTNRSIWAKFKSSWLRKTFNKKCWGCEFVKEGAFLKKIKASKTKKYTVI